MLGSGVLRCLQRGPAGVVLGALPALHGTPSHTRRQRKAQRGSQTLRAELVLLLLLPLPRGFGSLVEEPVKVFFDDGLVILQRCRHHVCV